MENQELQLQPINTEIALYHNASMLKIEAEEQDKLLASFDESLIEIRPDGLIFLPQTFWRKRLNDSFGIGQWCLVVKGQHKDPDPNKDKLYVQGVLMVRGAYMAEAVGEAELHSSNPMQSWASVWEAAKSDCITRCCKDLSIASELWQPQFIEGWKRKYAVEVWVEIKDRGGNVKSKKQWRKKDATPFWNEKNAQKQNTNTHPANTTVYNHSQPSNSGKPLISNEQYKKLLERVQAGDLDAYNKAIEAFSFEAAQRSLLDQTFETSKLIDNDVDYEQWQDAINQCSDGATLKKFYQKNKAPIDADPKIFQMVSIRQQSFANQKQAA